jgi:tetratricopeptide (TPR) repeat protein
MRRLIISVAALIAALSIDGAALAGGQMAGGQMPGGMGGQTPGGSPMHPPSEDTGIASTPSTEKPDVAAKKAFTAGVKSLNRAKEFEAASASAPNPDKKAKNLDKANDALNKALDQFTEALSNKGDMYDAWSDVGYVHLRLGAYAESVDDYNHALVLKPDNFEAIEYRAEAYLAVDRLEDAKSAYMDLFNHERNLAEQLMVAMQKWLANHRSAANGMRPADIDAFDKWIQERDGIAKQTASVPH